jgi:ABC-type glycerol-3-phosphate transport system permease component
VNFLNSVLVSVASVALAALASSHGLRQGKFRFRGNAVVRFIILTMIIPAPR